MDSYDLLVIGTGTAGSTAAFTCREAGFRVGVIDLGSYGGVCALRGCNPKKLLSSACEAVHRCTDMNGRGIKGKSWVDWKEIRKYKDELLLSVPKLKEEGFTEGKIDMYHDKARFIDEDSLYVEGKVLKSRFFLVATGSEPRKLNVPGAEHLSTSDDFFSMEELPKRIVFIGGGYVAFELAHISATLGANVKIIDVLEQPLGNFDDDMVKVILSRSKELGIEFIPKTSVTSIRKNGSIVVNVTSNSHEDSYEADLVLNATGRVPRIDGLGLEVAGVKVEKGRILVNEYLQSVSNPRVYAAGDAAGAGPQLTPVAYRDGELAAINMLKGNIQKPEYSVVPSVLFTYPPVASVGLSEAGAKKKGLRYRVFYANTSEKMTAKRIGLNHSAHKVLLEEGTGRILGAHLVGYNVDELINIFSIAITNKMTAIDLRKILWAYPTAAHGIDDVF